MSPKAVVVGGGIVGCSAALALVRKGWAVTVIERLTGVGRGSTALSSTVIRCHYTRPEAIRLAVEGRSIWQQWARYLGTSAPKATYEEVGVLFLLRRSGRAGVGPDSLGMKAEMNAQALGTRLQMMEYAGVDVHLLSARKLRKQFPQFNFPEEDVVGVWEPDSGYVAYPMEAVEDLYQAAQREGAVFLMESEVIGGVAHWVGGKRRLTGVKVVGSDGRHTVHDADAVINCAGPHSYAVNVALECPMPLTTTPQRQFIVEGTWSNPAPMPAMADLVNGFYLRPDRTVFKVGAVLPQDHVRFVMQPDGEVNKTEIAEAEERFLACLAIRAPNVRLTDVTTRIGYYDWTVSDSYPLIGPTDVSGYFVAMGTSGAWFKAGPAIGELVAESAHRQLKGDARSLMTLPYSGLKLDLARFGVSR